LKLTAKAHEKWWLGDYFPLGKAYFQGRTVSFGEGSHGVMEAQFVPPTQAQSFSDGT